MIEARVLLAVAGVHRPLDPPSPSLTRGSSGPGVSEDELEAIHEASLTILEEIGIDVLLPEAREILRRRRAPRSTGRAGPLRPRHGRSTRSAKAPSDFTLHARNPAHNVAIGGDSIVLLHGRQRAQLLRPGGRPAARQPRRLHELPAARPDLNIIHMIGGYPVEPVDLHPDDPPSRCLRDCVDADRQAVPRLLAGQERIRDGIEIARIARGIDARAARARALALHHHQHQLAAAPRLRRWRPASSRWRGPARSVVHDAVHAGRRHGAGDDRRRAGAAERRGAGRHRAGPDRAARARR